MSENTGAKKLIIIPAYNESESIAATVEGIRKAVPDYDFVVVNDSSTDNTLSLLKEIGANVLDLPVNLGIGGAVQTGYRYAKKHGYDVAVQLDGDGQHDPAELNKLYDALIENDADMVIGSRFIDMDGFQSSAARRAGIRFFTVLIKILTGTTITDPTSGYRMAGKRVINLFAEDYPMDYPEPESTAGILKMGGKVIEIPVKMRERQGGVSSISPLKAVYYMIKVSLAVIIEAVRARGKKL